MQLGKFNSDRDALLYAMSLDGWANESSGNVECPTGFFARISNYGSEVAEIRDAFPTETESLGDADICGHFLLQENSQGFVSVYDYGSQLELTRAFRILEEVYSEWDNQE
ncbi:hypothetical protein SEA_BILLNYE_251 [Streptomyces phage BillNye]|uniref:Uncharacterized protein n=1 Tax=Streptomyces phage BillNye TaxID=2079426 RepID=A0A2L1IW27_9CAUD|nr:hypothetical protein FDJ30_gp005 [Streptomyces phage BillNye]YP_009622798.1 hypothetical protein FDJ30_gp011 [Streptomyces phage BillNye]AVD99210.1 hypothetical protein SEA_BILLNYE_5 [Streptomyces phage BillNye]AVD99420.1 hypothetical protein SEA_BILLNYE_251 [Streptomyces phage BillNye]